MSNHLKLIAQLRKSFKEDTVCLFYHGDFDDFFTDKMIRLISFESEGKIRGNLAFVIAESFQNIVRHKNPFLSDNNENVFGIRGRKEYVHVFSSNLVSEITKGELSDRLESINSKEKEELREEFMAILERGELSDKGGAGMGLIEMARRSDNDLQYEFIETEKAIFSFNMQIDFKRDRSPNIYPNKLQIEENSILNDLIIDNNLLFIYKGEFSKEVLDPFLPIIDNVSKAEGKDQERVMRIANGLVQNIEQYGSKDPIGKRKGLFAMKKIPGGYYLCSGNYTAEDTSNLEELVNDMNESTHQELKFLYDRVHKHRSRDIDTVDRVGILDIRITSMQALDLKITEDAFGMYCMLGVKILVDGLD